MMKTEAIYIFVKKSGMRFSKEIEERSGNKCEVCGAHSDLTIQIIEPKLGVNPEEAIMLCGECKSQSAGEKVIDTNHWRCLNDSIWSEVDAVKVFSYRMINQLNKEMWARELLEVIYLEDDVLSWAQEGIVDPDAPKHLDSNGVELHTGDSVVLIKDLDVKGANFTAKRGTAVRNIRLVHDNPAHIEGKINGQSIVILTQYVKK